MDFHSVLNRHKSDVALIIGNGINKFGQAEDSNSWNSLLLLLAKKYLRNMKRSIPEGIALTEFYDLLELKSGKRSTRISLQKEFCELMQDWTPGNHHKNIVSWAQEADCPILTTNFENVLGEASECELLHTSREGFTDYYPWESYYGNKLLSYPKDGFGIWHINGMQHYSRSIRLGLSHYMGSVHRARNWMHRGGSERLFSGNENHEWLGVKTWLDLIFHKPLLIFGLQLDANEVFLRWLLVERARYFQKYSRRKKPAWYVYTDENESSGKFLFLEGVGVECIHASGYEEIYGAATWSRN